MDFNPDSANQNRTRQIVPGIMAGVAIFAVIVATGTYINTGKLLAIPVVLGTVGLFLLVWFLAWRGSSATSENDAEDDRPK